VGSIATDHIPGTHLFRLAVALAELAVDRILAGGHRDQLETPFDRDVIRTQVVGQGSLRLRLGDEEQEGKRRVLNSYVKESKTADLPSSVHLELDAIVSAFDQLLSDPDRAKLLQGSRLDRQGARLVHPIQLAIDDPKWSSQRL